MSLDNILSTVGEMVEVPSVIGNERRFSDYLYGLFSQYGEIQNCGKYLAVEGEGTQVLIAHIDRHGIIIDESGIPEYAAFNMKRKYGQEITTPQSIFEKAGQRFVGETVKSYSPSGSGEPREGTVTAYEVDFDNKRLTFTIDGLENLSENTPIGYHSKLVQTGDSFSSQIDNAISVAVAKQLYEDGFNGKLVLSCEEEIGMSGIHARGYLSPKALVEKHGVPKIIESKDILVLDVTPYSEEKPLDEGIVALRNRDEFSEFNPNLVSKIRSICESKNIPYDFKDEVINRHNETVESEEDKKSLGKTELGRIINESHGGLNGATIQLPTINYHTNNETASIQGLQNFYTLLRELVL